VLNWRDVFITYRKLTTIFLLIWSGVALAQAPGSTLRYRIPDGWAFPSGRALSNGHKILRLRSEDTGGRTRLLVFDDRNNVMADHTWDGTSSLSVSADNEVIFVSLGRYPESPQQIKVLDSNGVEQYTMDAHRMHAHPCLRGHDEFYLAYYDVNEVRDGVAEVYDTATGRLKARITSRMNGFLPVGDGKDCIIAAGASLWRTSYLKPDQARWKIDNIGANIFDISRLSDDLVEARLENGGGLAFVDTETGNIIYRLIPGQGRWKHVTDTRLHYRDAKGNLVVEVSGGPQGKAYYLFEITAPGVREGRPIRVRKVKPHFAGRYPGIREHGNWVELTFCNWLPDA